jgi:hypothetical protein
MKSTVCKAAVAAVFALAASAASAEVTVNYVNTEKFADLPTGDWERKKVLEDLAAYFKKLGEDLPKGQDLNLNIYNVDLAGQEVPGQRATGDMRVRDGKNDWPLIELQYSLTANGQIIDNGDAKISDVAYLQRMMKRAYEMDELRFEKRMVQEWFKKTILKK